MTSVPPPRSAHEAAYRLLPLFLSSGRLSETEKEALDMLIREVGWKPEET